jgi:hypothetical protein
MVAVQVAQNDVPAVGVGRCRATVQEHNQQELEQRM